MREPSFERFVELSEDEAGVAELVDFYLAHTREHLDEIGTALGEAHMQRASNAAHRCAGSSGVCGMSELAGALTAIEHSARQANLDAAREAYRRAEEELFAITSAWHNRIHAADAPQDRER